MVSTKPESLAAVGSAAGAELAAGALALALPAVESDAVGDCAVGVHAAQASSDSVNSQWIRACMRIS
jgi:hypothetical protein